MDKINLIEQTAKTLLDNGVLHTEELNALLEKASTQEEVDFYAQLYNYLIGKRQQEVIANEHY